MVRVLSALFLTALASLATAGGCGGADTNTSGVGESQETDSSMAVPTATGTTTPSPTGTTSSSPTGTTTGPAPTSTAPMTGGSCNPQFCPAPSFGEPCCVSANGPCGADMGNGCTSSVGTDQDGG
jgi:hypothetical protein